MFIRCLYLLPPSYTYITNVSFFCQQRKWNVQPALSLLRIVSNRCFTSPYLSKTENLSMFQGLDQSWGYNYVCPPTLRFVSYWKNMCMVTAVPFLGHLVRLQGNFAESYNFSDELLLRVRCCEWRTWPKPRDLAS